MSVNDTGSWRNAEPKYQDHTPPCSFNCPAGNDVVGFVNLTAEGKYREAWELILKTSPFPGICGRVCPHPCENDCNRKTLGGVVKISALERYLADINAEFNPQIPPVKKSRRKIAVIGSGPAGLSCAWQLARNGYAVTVFEKHPQAGGMMRLGIPDFRLPKTVLQREIQNIVRAGVEIKTGAEIGRDVDFKDLVSQFDAVFIACGFHQSYKLGIEGENHPEVISGIEFLRRTAFGEPFNLKQNVTVIGGGNTAIDTARTALRKGVKVTILYRRTRKEMPAIAEEIEEALEEGIEIQYLTAPVKVHTDNNGISKLECIRMELGEADSSGRRKPLPIKDSNFFLETAQIFTAVGESADVNFTGGHIRLERWGIPADVFGRTDNHKIFAGGDAATGEGTVTHAIGSGRKTALAISRYLEGDEACPADLIAPSLRNVSPRIVALNDLNLDYFRRMEAVKIEHLDSLNRRNNFAEIKAGLSENAALYEAQRCMSCGTCPGCDNCYVFCPDAAVSHSNNPASKYLIDIKHCKGCGLCAAECPRYCIEFEAVK